ncbi:hydroxyacid dehydrogenase [Actinoallomurus iriomotensis]|uniref:Lactate dehydrogenase n=1 Tax=Actinoallomurus iriomotensis TaxID=478107 RepID=A0A9W6VXF8_9ACTN|nr:hydroxyacid dehydrogenase [Actinoallomurus iriomotensis]GLY88898.1 lactate dehydrogenase [Actinoallomurus iriomotensis]
MKISVFEAESWERAAFQSLVEHHDVRFEPRPLDRNLAPEHSDADVISTFIYSSLDEGVLRLFDRLVLIATRSTGFDHIDADWCHRHAIAIANVPGYGENTVAEHVFALLLGLSHHIVEAADRTRRGDFSQTGLQGFDLLGRTMGVIGTGAIGRHTVRIAKGFGMDVLAFDIQPDDDLARELGFRYTQMNELLAACDVVSLHVPGGPATRHLIGENELRIIKPGAVIINTSRGSVLDTTALLRALSDGTVAAAGLDVIEDEPTVREEAELIRSIFARRHDLDTLLSDHVLLRMRNVLITPHTAFNTHEAVRRILDITCENIAAYTAGSPQNIIC